LNLESITNKPFIVARDRFYDVEESFSSIFRILTDSGNLAPSSEMRDEIYFDIEHYSR